MNRPGPGEPKDLCTLEAENASLRSRLDEAEEMLRAIRGGEVDALLIGEQVYTLESADAASNRFRGEVIAQVNEVVIAVDNDFHVTYLNPAAEREYGIDGPSMLGHHLKDFYSFEWVDPNDEAESFVALERDGYWRGENVHIKSSGERIDVESSVSRLHDSDGSPSGYLAVIRDISDRKRAEEAIQRAHEELEIRVKERTRELADANARLQDEATERAAAERQRSELLQRVVTIQEEERRRISIEIHDQLGQRVTALRFQLASILGHDGHFSEVPSLEDIEETARKLDTEVSFLTWELRPKSLDDLGLAEAARSFLDDWSIHHGVESEFAAHGFGERRLAPQSETHLYRILQEALHNIVKHANAAKVTVLLRWMDEELILIIEDDGIGFDPSGDGAHRLSDKGLGLVGMKERAIIMGGDVQVESEIGSGTTIHVRVPGNSIESQIAKPAGN